MDSFTGERGRDSSVIVKKKSSTKYLLMAVLAVAGVVFIFILYMIWRLKKKMNGNPNAEAVEQKEVHQAPPDELDSAADSAPASIVTSPDHR